MRRWRIGLLLVVILAGIGGDFAPPEARAAASTLRIAPLPGGLVLIVGLGRSQVYEPATSSIVETGRPAEPVGFGHALTPLRDGRVLLTGGITGTRGERPSPRAEIYSVATGFWAGTIPMPRARSDHATIVLPDGRVLVAGGTSDGATDIYNPSDQRWDTSGSLRADRRAGLTLTLLRDGRVLATGGATAERYDPATGEWTVVAAPRQARSRHTATLLADGRVLIAGGESGAGNLAAAELYDPVADRWAEAAALGGARSAHTATPLPDGRVVVIGGGPAGASLSATVEIYDPAADRWAFGAPTDFVHTGHAALLLPGDRVLLVGGTDDGGVTEQYRLDAPTRCFPETGQCVTGRFLDHWETRGALPINGYPLAAPRFEQLEDGKVYFVQYFERTRLELHPANPAPYDVLLGQFGRRIQGLVEPPVRPAPGKTFFPETGHNVGPVFQAYWEANGGLAQFGLPIGEERGEQLGGGRYAVQYFERARLEFHPENVDPQYRVLLGQFGRQILVENDRLGIPQREGMGLLYLSDPYLAAEVGKPGEPTVGPGAYLPFEYGAMLWRGDARRIYVLCNDRYHGADSQSGTMPRGDDAQQSPVTSFPDTWAPGQEPGGGAAPAAGRFLPAAGFGKVWREHATVRDCLGYALTPTELTYTQRYQPFTQGAMLSLALPEGRFIYVMTNPARNLPPNGCAGPDTGCRSAYVRYPDPGR